MNYNTHIPKFRRFVLQNFPFIEKDFDALTDYQLICKVVEYLNTVINSQNGLIDEMENLVQLFNQLKDFVDNYFDNLDVQEEINNKLDAMVEAGTLQEIIADYLNSKAVFGFDTVADMVSATNLIAGSYAKTLGYHAKDDFGASLYKIVEDDLTENGSTIIALNTEGLFATLVKETNIVKPEQFGAYGDGEEDDTDALQSAINYSIENGCTLEFNGQYKVLPKTLDDSTKVCLTFSNPNTGLQAPSVELKFNRTARLFTTSTDECTLLRWEARNGKITNAILEGVTDKTTLFEMSRTILTSTNYNGWNMDNIIDGCIFRYGKNAVTMEGYCFYNKFTNCRIYNCTNGVIMQMTYRERQGLEQAPSVNRNDFVNVNMNLITNWGIRIEYGDTNKFVNVDLEGCGNGIYIDNPKSHSGDFSITPLYDSTSNTFVNVMIEAITTLEWYNRGIATRIYGTSGNWGNKAQMVIKPEVYIGGTDQTTSIEKVLGLTYNKDVTQYTSSTHYSIETDRPLAVIGGIYDYFVQNGDAVKMSFSGSTFVTDSADYQSNITSATQNFQCKSVGSIVYFCGSITSIVPTSTSDAIRLVFRTETKSWLQARENVYKNQDVGVLLQGKKGGTNVILHAVIKPDYIYVYPPDGGWNSSNNTISLNLSYMRNGDL